jgi:hypothetical protein
MAPTMSSCDMYHLFSSSLYLQIAQVENTLFKVHRSYLCQVSEAFREMFMAPIPGGVPEGSSDERPIVLDQVEAKEFEMFLSVIYGK